MAFFALGLSLTLIFKGHNIESEIGENSNMKKLGIECAARQIREEERALRGEDVSCGALTDCSPDGCASCGAGTE